MYKVKAKQIKTDKLEDVMKELYLNTTKKFYIDNQPEAVKFKDIMDREVKLYTKKKIENAYSKGNEPTGGAIGREPGTIDVVSSLNNKDVFSSLDNKDVVSNSISKDLFSSLDNKLVNVYASMSKAKANAMRNGIVAE